MEHLQNLINSLGIDADALAKMEAGELNPQEYAKSFLTEYENTVKTRITNDLRGTLETEAFAKAYSKNEALLAKEFGLDLKEFEGVEKNQRTTAILAKIKDLQKLTIESIQNGDSQKVAQLTAQLEKAHAQYDADRQSWETEKQSIFDSYAQKEQQSMFQGTIDGLIDSFDESRFGKKEMRALFNMDLSEAGYVPEFDNENGKIWLTKNGARVPHPKAATKNLDIVSFFELVAENNKFKKESNGGSEKPVFEFKDKTGKQVVHPAKLKEMSGNK